MPQNSFCLGEDGAVIFGPLSQSFGEEFDFIHVVKTDSVEFFRGNLVVKKDESMAPGVI
jgi:hypothetical protein